MITDGMVGIPEASLFESLMGQLRHQNIACSFVQVGSGAEKTAGLGQVPYGELMQFMATATFGAYFSKIPDLVNTQSLLSKSKCVPITCYES